MNTAPTEEADILRHFRELLERKQTRWFEREKSEQEQEIIREVLPRLLEFIREFGGDPVLNLTSDNIHIIDESKLTAGQRSPVKNERGWYSAPDQAVFILPDSSRTRTAEAIVHELLHFNSFASLQVIAENQRDRPGPHIEAAGKALGARRIGLAIFDRSNTVRYFRELDEAVIEELTKRFDEHYFASIPALAEEIEQRKLMRGRVTQNSGDIAAVVKRQVENGTWETAIFPYAYSEERKYLNSLVHEIFERNKSEFSSEEQVFKLFAEALMSGRLLTLARIVEKTYGEGSFRQLAIDTAKTTPAAKNEPENKTSPK